MGTVRSKRGARKAKPSRPRARRTPWLVVATIVVVGALVWRSGGELEGDSAAAPHLASAPGMTEPAPRDAEERRASRVDEDRRERHDREAGPGPDIRPAGNGAVSPLTPAEQAASDAGRRDARLWDGRSLEPDTCLRYHAGRSGSTESTTWWCRPTGPPASLDARMERAFAERFGGGADVRRTAPWPAGDRKLGARGIVVYWNLRPSGLLRVTISNLEEIPGEEFLLEAGFRL